MGLVFFGKASVCCAFIIPASLAVGATAGWICLRLLAILFSRDVVCFRIYFRICVILSSKFCATLKTALGVVCGPEVFVQVVTLCAPVPLATPLPPTFQLAPLCLF